MRYLLNNDDKIITSIHYALFSKYCEKSFIYCRAFPLNLLYPMQLCGMAAITLPIFLMGKPRMRGDLHGAFDLERNSVLATVKTMHHILKRILGKRSY